jgi:fibronectin-binding autotransporter adhesin
MSKQKRGSRFVMLGFVLCCGFSAQAVTYYWDGTSTGTSADGGSGLWNTTLNNWNDASTSGAAVIWPSTGTDNVAVFGGTAGTVTNAAGGVTANKLIFTTANYVITGGPLALNGTSPTITNGGLATINANLTGSDGLSKLGNGTLTLNGVNTGLSGPLTISGATAGNSGGVQVQSTAAFGAFTSVSIANNSFLALVGTTLGAEVAISLAGGGGASAPPGALRSITNACVVNGPVSLADGSVRVANFTGTSLTFNGAVTAPAGSGRGLFVRYGANQGVIFTNPSNYWEGSTAISEGSYYFYPGTLPSSNRLEIAGTGSAWFESNGSFTRSLGGGTNQVDILRGSGTFGTTAISGFSARGGDLRVNLGGAGATIIWAWGTSVPGFRPANLGLAGPNATGTLTFENPINLNTNNALRALVVSNGLAAVDAVLSGTLSGVTGSGVNKTGAGTLALTADNTYEGLTVISAGALHAGNGGTSGTLGAGMLTNNASFVVNRSNDYNLMNLMVGTGTLLKLGAGRLTLSATNAYSGLTTVSNGVLAAGCDNALKANSALTLSGGTFDAGSYSNALGTLTLSTGLTNTLAVGLGSCKLSFTNLNASSTGWLVITGKLGPTSVRFGTSSTALTKEQLDRITANGHPVYLDSLGYLSAHKGVIIQFF